MIDTISNHIFNPISGEWGKDIDDADKNKRYVLRTTNFTNIGKLKLDDIAERYIEPKVFDKKRLEYGDIIIEKSGGSDTIPVGRVVYFNIKDNNYTCNNFTSIIRCKDSLNSKYLFYSLYFNHKKGITSYYQNKTTGIRNLQLKRYIDTTILIPPLQQQEKIVKVLDLTSNLIEKQKELLEKYDLFLKSKFIEMFGDPIKNPMEWETEKLGKLADWKGGGTPSRKKPEYFDGDIPWITTISLGKIYINEEDAVEFITNEAVNNSATKIIPKNSIIIGTRVGVGKVSINKSELCTNQDIMSMTNISTNLSNIFLYFFINYYNDFLKSQQRGATIQGITGPVLKDLDTILPPIELQNKFASIVEKCETIKEKENQKLKQLEDLHNSLMQKAFKGEIV
ncbi:hypothetical protein CRV03_02550 [Arcobacter sp. F155]|uniref:restriction endonuclease subunit S n=1 Tax=Arcobacter sp. F155 TaxID=2044512 RepID=UPI00100ADB6D|nr:restriction endonuclease subunit S [Arcobacter sp. F155]RXJ77870.1 hypothetical protein CRV03_02550 [Arcobacter sp. F155]